MPTVHIQNNKNETAKIMNRYALQLRHSLLLLQNKLDNNSHFKYSTACSAKTKRKKPPKSKPSLKTCRSNANKSNKQRLKSEGSGFMSHYDKLQRARSKSMKVKTTFVVSQLCDKKKSIRKDQKKVITSSKRKCTVPVEFSFVTMCASKKRKTKSVMETKKQKKYDKNVTPKNKISITRKQHRWNSCKKMNYSQSIKAIHNNTLSHLSPKQHTKKTNRSLSFASPTITSISKKNSKYTAKVDIERNSYANKKTIPNKKNKQKTTTTVRKKSFKTIVVDVQNKKKYAQSTKTRTASYRSFSFGASDFRKIKTKLRKGITINNTKLKHRSNIQSVYAQKNTRRNRKSSLLTPIHECVNYQQSSKSNINNNTDIEDIAIDQILTEDVYTIDGIITPSFIKTIQTIISPKKRVKDEVILQSRQRKYVIGSNCYKKE